MKKFNQFLLTAILALPCTGVIQAENLILTTPHDFQVVSLSPNGKWACGIYVNGAQIPLAFRWNLESDEIEMIGDSNESTAWSIANDGTVSGSFSCTDIMPQGRPMQTPGINRDGKGWEALELPEEFTSGECYGYAITPDGRNISGSVPINGVLVPYIWRDGKIYKSFGTGKHAMPYAISPDGETVAGWAYGEKGNRVATYWKPDGTPVYLLDAGKWGETMFNRAQAFSPNGKKLLYWGGWAPLEEENQNFLYCIYDIETDTRIKIQAPSMSSTLDFFSITDNGMLVGSETERGYLYFDGKGMYIDDYLNSIGVDLSQFDDFYDGGDAYAGQLPIFRIMNVTNDAKTFIFLFYDKQGALRSMCLKIDQDMTNRAPAGIKASQLAGINTVELTWHTPLGMKGIRGYNIYRDGKKLNGFLPVSRLYHYDENLEAGTYSYRIGTVNSAGAEELSEPVMATVTDRQLPTPLNAFARQKGVNSAFMSWDSPESNLIHKRYYDLETKHLTSLSVYVPTTMETAVMFDKKELAAYKDAKVKEVTFVPMGNHDAWTLAFYTRDTDGTLKEIKTVDVTQTLNLRVPNTVTLPEPIELPEGNLIVAVRVQVKEGQEEVIGAIDGNAVRGYSDLLRLTSEPDFYSAYDSSLEAGQTVINFSWTIDIALEIPGLENNKSLTHFNIYADGEKVAQTSDLSYTIADLADGIHKFAVGAVYEDGEESQRVEKELEIASIYEGVDDAKVEVALENDKTKVTTTWDAPLNLDKTRVSYALSDTPSRGVKAPENTLIIGADYKAALLKGYDGYKVANVRFYPMCDAIFTVGLYENGVCIHEQEVDQIETGKWNTIPLNKEVKIRSNADYRLVVDAFDAEPGKEIFGVDNAKCFEMTSDLYSINGGLSWNSLGIESGLYRSWLLSMDLVEDGPSALTPDGYDVLVDDKAVNASRISETSYVFEIDATDNSTHSLRVNTYYSLLAEPVEGGITNFRLAASGIDETLMASITLRQGHNNLVAEGEGIESMILYSASGNEVTRADGNTMALDGVAAGVYIVEVNAGNAGFTRKIIIRR